MAGLRVAHSRTCVLAASPPGERPADPAAAEVLRREGEDQHGGSIMMTATAMTDPQSAAFCWKNALKPTGMTQPMQHPIRRWSLRVLDHPPT
jgi:hypothetical protein